jgi:hypothetical protein
MAPERYGSLSTRERHSAPRNRWQCGGSCRMFASELPRIHGHDRDVDERDDFGLEERGKRDTPEAG